MQTGEFNTVKSKPGTAGFWIVMITTCVFFVLLVSAVAQVVLRLNWIPFIMQSTWESVVFIGVLFLAFAFFYSQLHRDCKRIEIDTVSQRITVSNLLWKGSKVYSFASLDGYIDMMQRSRTGEHRVIYLVQDKKYVVKLSAFYYSNLNELENALQRVPFLGRKQFSFLTSFKILFGRRV